MNDNNNRALEFLDSALQALQGKRPDHQRAALFVGLAVKEVQELKEQVRVAQKRAEGRG